MVAPVLCSRHDAFVRHSDRHGTPGGHDDTPNKVGSTVLLLPVGMEAHAVARRTMLPECRDDAAHPDWRVETESECC